MTASYFKFRLCHLPIIIAVWLTGTYLLTYVIAVSEGHVSPVFPYISNTGTTPPESCIFGFMLNIGAALLFVGVYVRYRLLEFNADLNVPACLNNFSYFMGILCCLGIVTVANFQEENLLAVHMLGALCTFGSALIYCCLQTWVTWKFDVSQFLKLFRTFLCILLIPAFINNFIFGGLANRQFKGTNMLNWTREDGGYNMHLVAAFSEWVMAIALNIYIFTFANEFKRIRFEGAVFRKNENYIISC